MLSQQWVLRGTNGIESLALEEVEVPDPGAYEIQIKLHAASLNFRDLKVARVSKEPSGCRWFQFTLPFWGFWLIRGTFAGNLSLEG